METKYRLKIPRSIKGIEELIKDKTLLLLQSTEDYLDFNAIEDPSQEDIESIRSSFYTMELLHSEIKTLKRELRSLSLKDTHGKCNHCNSLELNSLRSCPRRIALYDDVDTKCTCCRECVSKCVAGI